MLLDNEAVKQVRKFTNANPYLNIKHSKFDTGVTEISGTPIDQTVPDSIVATAEDPFGSAPFSMPEVLRERASIKKSGGKA